MSVWFNPSTEIDKRIREVANEHPDFGPEFAPNIRAADPKFGDYQANGVLGHAKRFKKNPRELGQTLIGLLEASGKFDANLIELSLAGPGFINLKLSPKFIWQWLLEYRSDSDFARGARSLREGRRTVIDYPSANTAKQAHIGHLRPMVIGQSIAKLLAFCGAELVRDNHIGDWGTNFGTLIMKIKRDRIDLDQLDGDLLVELDRLYKEGSALEAEQPEVREISRQELVLLQNGDPNNTAVWQKIVDISKAKIINPINPFLLRELRKLSKMKRYIVYAPSLVVRILINLGSWINQPDEMIKDEKEFKKMLKTYE